MTASMFDWMVLLVSVAVTDAMDPVVYHLRRPDTRSRRFLGWRVRSFTPGSIVMEAKAFPLGSFVSEHHAPKWPYG